MRDVKFSVSWFEAGGHEGLAEHTNGHTKTMRVTDELIRDNPELIVRRFKAITDEIATCFLKHVETELEKEKSNDNHNEVSR